MFKTGIPYIPRKMMCSSSPTLQIASDENGEWTITTISMFRTAEIKFKPGEQYEEHMPGGVVIKVYYTTALPFEINAVNFIFVLFLEYNHT